MTTPFLGRSSAAPNVDVSESIRHKDVLRVYSIDIKYTEYSVLGVKLYSEYILLRVLVTSQVDILQIRRPSSYFIDVSSLVLSVFLCLLCES
jgi:hypothetical protein